MTRIWTSSRPTGAVLIAMGTVLVAGCPARPGTGTRGAAPTAGAGEVAVNEPPPEFPTDFEPGPPPGDPDPPDPDKPGLAYLKKVGPRLAEPWADFIENSRLYLPPDHPLNDEALAARVVVRLTPKGELAGVDLTDPSGNADFDQAVVEIVRDAAPYPTAPAALLSDDRLLRLSWLFARDRRQAGLATAAVEQMRWPVERAVAEFVAAGDVTTAARRVREALDHGTLEGGAAVELAGKVARAAVVEALRADDADVRAAAIAAAGRGRVAAAGDALRQLIAADEAPELRARAARALGAIGDEEAAPLLGSLIDGASPEAISVAVGAAAALVALDEGDRARERLSALLASDDEAGRAVAVAALTEVPAPDAVPTLAEIVGAAEASRDLRRTACVAIGRSAAATGARKRAVHVLRSGLGARDAALRAACARGLAEAAAHGASDRLSYWKVVELLKKDRDERVRAAAALAAPRLEPRRFPREMYVVARERSPQVLAALAEGLAVVPGKKAMARLRALAAHDDASVRLAAVRALIERGGDEAIRVAAERASDPDPEVRLAAVAALSDPEALERLLDEDAAELRAAALEALARARGLEATVGELVRRLDAAPAGGAERARLAGAWLAAG